MSEERLTPLQKVNRMACWVVCTYLTNWHQFSLPKGDPAIAVYHQLNRVPPMAAIVQPRRDPVDC